MYSNEAGAATANGDRWSDRAWDQLKNGDQSFRTDKRFVRCICPKCTDAHQVYMLWTGRGVPRKYCSNCKALVSGYDDAVLYEAAVSVPGRSKKNDRCHACD